MAIDSRAGFALDVQGLSKLKYSARDNPEESLKETTQQFEALFLQKMLKSMRDALPKSDLLKSDSMDTYTQMLDQQWAQQLSGQGIGLSDMMVKQLSKKENVSAAQDENANDSLEILRAQSRDIPSAFAIPLSETQLKHNARLDSAQNMTTAVNKPTGPLIEGYGALENGLQARETHQVMMANVAPHVSAFVTKMGAAARAVSERTGIPDQLILAQAALESGWGAREISAGGGRNSHNLFGIKATGGWQGERNTITTTEYDNGQASKIRDAFRVYDSYEAAFSDYARLITDNPRYQAVLDASTPEAAAHALQKCGYATDPRYGEKLVAIMSQLPTTRSDMSTSLYADRNTPAQGDATQSAARQLEAARAYALENEASRIF